MTWSLYAQWRYRGLSPFAALNGSGAGEPPFPGRVEALLTAFAIHAAEVDRAVLSIAEGFSGEE